MKILVTGGTGYIGSHTVVEILKEGHEVVIIDNLYNSDLEVLNRIESISGIKPKFYEVDILDREGLRKVFSENNIDAVVHFAGLKAVGESVEKPLMYYNNNVSGTVVLCEVMAEFNVKKIVFSSSATVYGMNNEAPFTEEMPTSTTNPYGESKLMIEHILTDLQNSDPEWSVALLRYFNPIGAHESGLIGEDPTGIPNNLMPYITQVAVGKREKLSVFGSDYETHDGTGVRDYIHVVDLAIGHLKALDRIVKDNDTHIYNLGTGIGVSVLDMVNAFKDENGVEIPYQLAPRRAGDIATSYAKADKAFNELNWKATKDLRVMVKDSWNWQSKNPNGYKN
jgi:UDP-glucose 4-epimerase